MSEKTISVPQNSPNFLKTIIVTLLCTLVWISAFGSFSDLSQKLGNSIEESYIKAMLFASIHAFIFSRWIRNLLHEPSSFKRRFWISLGISVASATIDILMSILLLDLNAGQLVMGAIIKAIRELIFGVFCPVVYELVKLLRSYRRPLIKNFISFYRTQYDLGFHRLGILAASTAAILMTVSASGSRNGLKGEYMVFIALFTFAAYVTARILPPALFQLWRWLKEGFTSKTRI